MRLITTLIILFVARTPVIAQTTDPPAVEEVLRLIVPDAHGLDFVQTGLSSSFPGLGAFKDPAFGPIYKIGKDVTAPKPRKTPDPDFPRHAKQKRVVVVWAVIGTDGRVKAAKIAQSDTPEIDKAILQTIQNQWLFEPVQYKDQPVAVQINIQYLPGK